jgi:hypothetical protein
MTRKAIVDEPLSGVAVERARYLLVAAGVSSWMTAAYIFWVFAHLPS